MAMKRPFDRNPKGPNGRRKMQKMNPADKSSDPFAYRVLCHLSKVGGLVGKGGGIVTKIREETGAKIRIEDVVPGCDERIVIISGSDKEGQSSGVADVAGDDENVKGEDDIDGGGGEDGNEEEEKNVKMESDSQVVGTGLTSAQRALLLVAERITCGDSEKDGGDGGSKESSSVVVRLLVHGRQVGCLLGKAGSVIKQMSAESGAVIRVLSRDMIPVCASAADDLVQITGHLDVVKKALQSISQRLHENPARGTETLSLNKHPGPSSFPFTSFPPPADVLPSINLHPAFPRPPFPPRNEFPPRLNENVDFHGPPMQNFLEGRSPASPKPLTFRLVCTSDKARNVIGKAGSSVKRLQHDTGCEIKISDGPSEIEDRVITVTGPAVPDDRISPPQDAVFRLLEKIAMPDNKKNTVLIRILVSGSQRGCLLGKGGSVITEMRKLSGANIRMLSKDQMPKCASEKDEAVMISGEFEAVQEAIFQITSRLKHNHFRDKFPALNHSDSGRPPFMDQGPRFPLMGQQEPSPPGSFSNFGSSFRQFGPGPTGGLHEPFGPPPGRGEKFSSAQWSARGIGEGPGPMPMHDILGPPQRMGGFPGGGQLPIITNTTIDVVVPRSVVPSIYGEEGDSLKQIRQISGATIIIKEPEPGATEAIIIISGAPDQTHAAQSLIQAFVLSETEAS